jgi:hypothetical protein
MSLLRRLFLVAICVMGEITSLRGYTRHISLAGHRCVTFRGLSFVSTRGSILAYSLMNGEKETIVGEFLLAEKKYFSEFYEENVSCGSAMSLDVFLMSSKIDLMLEKKVLTVDEVSDVWISLWGCNCKCLTEEEAFETISAIYDLKKVYAG